MADEADKLDTELEALILDAHTPNGEITAELISQYKQPGTKYELDGDRAPFLALEFVMGEEVDADDNVHGEMKVIMSHQDPLTVQMYRNAIQVLAENF